MNELSEGMGEIELVKVQTYICFENQGTSQIVFVSEFKLNDSTNYSAKYAEVIQYIHLNGKHPRVKTPISQSRREHGELCAPNIVLYCHASKHSINLWFRISARGICSLALLSCICGGVVCLIYPFWAEGPKQNFRVNWDKVTMSLLIGFPIFCNQY